MSELPPGWVEALLGELGSWSGGGTPSKRVPAYWVGEIPWVSPKDMKVERIRDTIDHVSAAAVDASTTKVVPKGSVLVVTRSGILSHSLPVAVTERDVALNQDLKALVPSEGVASDYVAWALRSAAREILRDCSKAGTTVSNIDTRRLLAYQIPLPPLNEQRRIVAAIEEHLSRLNAADASLGVALRRLVALREGSLDQAIDGYPERPVGEFARIFVGATPSRRRPELWGGGTPWVSSGEVAFGRITMTRETIAPDAVTSPDRIHPPGTVLLGMIGEGKTRGQAAVLDVAAAHNQNSAAIRLDPAVCIPEWLFYVLMARYEETRRAGTGAQQAALNRARVGALLVPLPPLEEQRRIVAEVEERLSRIDAMRASIERAQRRSSALRAAILERAFRGELVPQDPADEPAEALLARIRTERESGRLRSLRAGL